MPARDDLHAVYGTPGGSEKCFSSYEHFVVQLPRARMHVAKQAIDTTLNFASMFIVMMLFQGEQPFTASIPARRSSPSR